MAESVSNIPDEIEKMTVSETSSSSVQDKCKSPENGATGSGSISCNNGTDSSSIVSSSGTDCSEAEILTSTSTDPAADESGASASQEAPQQQDQSDAGGFLSNQ